MKQERFRGKFIVCVLNGLLQSLGDKEGPGKIREKLLNVTIERSRYEQRTERDSIKHRSFIRVTAI